MNAFNWQAPGAQRAGIKDSKAAPPAPPMQDFSLSRSADERQRQYKAREMAAIARKPLSGFNVPIATPEQTLRSNSIGRKL